jgi:diadenosine tetraphosphatase ApaH/serine/threonine PP2A family protein phosphatase
MNVMTALRTCGALALLAFMAVPGSSARADLTPEQLAKISQNPIGNIINVPIQENANLNDGADKRTRNVVNIQPVYPVEISKDWNLLTRTILPLISQPESGGTRNNGVGDMQFELWLTPSSPGKYTWGAGPFVQAPTHSNAQLGNDHWGLGPTVVLVHVDKESPWVYGVTAYNVWSLGSSSGSPSFNNGLIQPFINYNLPGGTGTYLTSGPQITVNWKADSGQRLTVPIGGGIGHIFHLGKLPMNMSVQAYYNVVRPDESANWLLQAQMKFMFPK